MAAPDPDRPGTERRRKAAESDPDASGYRYGVLEADPDDDEDAQTASPVAPAPGPGGRRAVDGTHFHYLLEFCHTHPGAHEKKDPNWRQEHVTEWRPGEEARGRDLPEDFAAFLDGRLRFGVKVGLDNIRALLAALRLDRGHPPVILVGGTNGKGTVAATLGDALSFAGYRPGVYTSPHVERFLERIQVAGADPDDEVLDEACIAVRAATEGLDANGVHPTYFEVATALALAVFRAHRASPLILEVGMGGRGDAVNALEPALSIITNVGSDHAEHLGMDLAARVREKAGIMRPGVPCLTSAQGEALRLLEREAIARATPLTPVLPAAPRVEPDDAALGLVRTAIAHPDLVARLPRARDLDPTSVHLPRMPGRQEVFPLPDGRWVLLDVAHNAESLDELGRRLDALPMRSSARVLLTALLRDKPVDALARLAHGRFGAVHVTTAEGDRARPADALAGELRAAGVDVSEATAGREAAFEQALAATPTGGLLVVAGSFYLVGPLRPLVRRAARGG